MSKTPFPLFPIFIKGKTLFCRIIRVYLHVFAQAFRCEQKQYGKQLVFSIKSRLSSHLLHLSISRLLFLRIPSPEFGLLGISLQQESMSSVKVLGVTKKIFLKRGNDPLLMMGSSSMMNTNGAEIILLPILIKERGSMSLMVSSNTSSGMDSMKGMSPTGSTRLNWSLC